MIFSENRFTLFGIMLSCLSLIFSENRFTLFGIMLYPKQAMRPARIVSKNTAFP